MWLQEINLPVVLMIAPKTEKNPRILSFHIFFLYNRFCIGFCLLARRLKDIWAFRQFMKQSQSTYFVLYRAAGCICDAGHSWTNHERQPGWSLVSFSWDWFDSEHTLRNLCCSGNDAEVFNHLHRWNSPHISSNL